MNRKYDVYKRELANMVYKFFEKTGLGARVNVNEGLAQELHKPVIKTSKEGKFMQRLK